MRSRVVVLISLWAVAVLGASAALGSAAPVSARPPLGAVSVTAAQALTALGTPMHPLHPPDSAIKSAQAGRARLPEESVAWALLDRRTGQRNGSAMAATSTVESMIKPWIVADDLRRLAAANREPSPRALRELTLMIIDSNDPLAEKYYRMGGSDAVVERLIRVCGLTDVTIVASRWSLTQISARDATRLGLCLADGRAAGPLWTSWLLDTMRAVRGGVDDQDSVEVQGGRWGIIEGLAPSAARQTAIKNGWTRHADGWHVTCLAVHPDWVLSVLLRTSGSLRAAANSCRDVAVTALRGLS